MIICTKSVPAAYIKIVNVMLEGEKHQSIFQRSHSFWISLDLNKKHNLCS